MEGADGEIEYVPVQHQVVEGRPLVKALDGGDQPFLDGTGRAVASQENARRVSDVNVRYYSYLYTTAPRLLGLEAAAVGRK